ncbi:hypothetical protein BVX97_01810 [bacterium E08(2017)]|nr:hypothetical protein BVX97_01810 [bacterium E08(2017)]
MIELGKLNKLACMILFVVVLAGSSLAQNTLISGAITNTANWDTGLPTTLGNIGIIDSDNTNANEGIFGPSITNLYLSQTGGYIKKQSKFFVNHEFKYTEYEISDGALDTSTGLIFNNSSSFTISGGTVRTLQMTIKGSSTFAISSGSLTLTSGSFTTQGGTYDFTGGIVDVDENFISGFSASGTFNFSGDVIISATGQVGVNAVGDRFVNIGLGDGSITAGSLEAKGMTIDWAHNSRFTFATTNILNDTLPSAWSNLWDIGKLTYNGSNATELGMAWEDATNWNAFGGYNRFNVDSNGLTLAYEPPPSGTVVIVD